MERYNQKVATCCQWLQAIDKDGDYNELNEEYSSGETTLSEALQELREVVTDEIEDNDTEEYKRILEYINY